VQFEKDGEEPAQRICAVILGGQAGTVASTKPEDHLHCGPIPGTWLSREERCGEEERNLGG
jgi:hypothetical protein